MTNDKNFEAKALDDADLDQVNGGSGDTYAKANAFYRDFRRDFCSKCRDDGSYDELGRPECSFSNPIALYYNFSEEQIHLNGGKCPMFTPKL